MKNKYLIPLTTVPSMVFAFYSILVTTVNVWFGIVVLIINFSCFVAFAIKASIKADLTLKQQEPKCVDPSMFDEGIYMEVYEPKIKKKNKKDRRKAVRKTSSSY